MVHDSPNPRPINYDISNLLFTVDSSGVKKLSYTINYNFIVPQDQIGSSFYLVTTIPSLSQDWNDKFYPSYPSGSYDVSLNFTNKQPTNDVSGSIAVYNMDSSKVMKKYLSPTFNFNTSLKSQISSKPDSVFSSSEPTQSIIDIIPSIPEAQAVTDSIIYGVAPGNHKEQAIIESQSVPPLPTFLSLSGITDKSVSITWDSWNSSRYIDFGITNWLYTLKNNDTGQTIKQQSINRQQSGIAETSLTSNTNYRAYLIAVNAFGNSNEQSIDFKTLGPTTVVTTPVITISAEVQAILTKFDNNDYEYPYTDLPALINLVKNGSLSNNDFLITINQLLDQKTIIDKTIVIPTIVPIVVEDTSISENMVSQSIGAFKLEGDRVQGDILYIAESVFNPYYYNKTITSVIQIKDQSGYTVKTKTNNLNFTATERDERISINENVGDLNAVKIDFFVWQSIESPIAFSIKKTDEIVAVEVGLSPCPIGQHRDFNNKCVPNDKPIGNSLLGKFMGVTALIGTLALLGSKGR